MSLTAAFRHVFGPQKPVKRNPWPRCLQCRHRYPSVETCSVCQCCSTCCHKCGTCKSCLLVCPGHRGDTR